MNYRNILKIYNLERQLGDDETAFLNTLRRMSDSERELLVESLSPGKATKKAGKKSSSKSAGKSARASSLQQQIQSTTRADSKSTLCGYSIDGKVCHGTENDGIHDAMMGYVAYHEFQPESVAVATGD